MRIALVQVPCDLGDKKANLSKIRENIAKVEADLFVFCETFVTGYMVRDRFHELAEYIDGESVNTLLNLSQEYGVHILTGIPLWDEGVHGVLRNSAVAVSPDGNVQRYDKLFLANFGPFEEKLYFGEGERPVIFKLDGFKFGITICYDIFFPELSKYYALNGAEAIVCISAAPNTSRPLFEKVLPARAVENTVYTIYVNQVGTQLNQVFHGGSQAHSPSGDLLTRCNYYSPDIRIMEVERSVIYRARHLRPTVRNTLASTWCTGLWSNVDKDI